MAAPVTDCPGRCRWKVGCNARDEMTAAGAPRSVVAMAERLGRLIDAAYEKGQANSVKECVTELRQLQKAWIGAASGAAGVGPGVVDEIEEYRARRASKAADG